MKKILSILLSLAMVLSLTACGEDTQAPQSSNGNNSVQSESTTENVQNTTPLSDTANPAVSSKLGITFIGENQAVFTFTDEIVKTIESSDENSPYISVDIEFDMGDGYVINCVPKEPKAEVTDTVVIKPYVPNERIQRLNNEINRLIDTTNSDKDTIKKLIFECAEEKYRQL